MGSCPYVYAGVSALWQYTYIYASTPRTSEGLCLDKTCYRHLHLHKCESSLDNYFSNQLQSYYLSDKVTCIPSSSHNCYLRVMTSCTKSYPLLSWWPIWSWSRFRFIEQIFRSYLVQMLYTWQIYYGNVDWWLDWFCKYFLNWSIVWFLTSVTDLFFHEVHCLFMAIFQHTF